MMTIRQEIMASAMAAAVTFTGAAYAMTKAEMKVEEERIAAEFKMAKAKCESLASNAKDVCLAEANGIHRVAKAEFEQRKGDTPKSRYNVRIARAEADYGVAKEKCDDLSGNAKDVCVKDAKAALTRATADAKADLDSGKARAAASDRVAEVRQDAAAEKRNADYAAAKERCDTYSGDARDRCVADARARFGIK